MVCVVAAGWHRCDHRLAAEGPERDGQVGGSGAHLRQMANPPADKQLRPAIGALQGGAWTSQGCRSGCPGRQLIHQAAGGLPGRPGAAVNGAPPPAPQAAHPPRWAGEGEVAVGTPVTVGSPSGEGGRRPLAGPASRYGETSDATAGTAWSLIWPGFAAARPALVAATWQPSAIASSQWHRSRPTADHREELDSLRRSEAGKG
jgi:hypothetical protein